MHFSYSTLNMLRTHSHCWINKQMGIKPEQKWYFTAGTEGHDLIQKHVSNAKKDPRLEGLEEYFPIVEKRPFDPDCKFSFMFEGYEIIGFFDGKNYETRHFLEIKLSGQPWSIGKFKRAVQRKIYAVAEPVFTHATLITGSLHPNEWKQTPPKVYTIENTDKDREEAKKWLSEGIEIFENGDFNGGLDESGRCTDPRCPWGNKCHFKSF